MPNQPSNLRSFLECVMSNDFLVLDTETTGLGRTDEICDLAIIDRKGEILFNSFIKPVGPIYAEATAIHGITNEMVSNAPTWKDVRQDIIDIIGDRVVVTYNATFDRKMFHQSDESHRLVRFDWAGLSQWYCAMFAFAEDFGEWDDYFSSYKRQKLSTAVGYFSIDIREAHRALSDAQMTLDVINCMIAEQYIREQREMGLSGEE